VTRPATIVFVVLTALSCMTLVYFLRMGWPSAAFGAKLIASSSFIATALSVGALKHRYGQVLFAGLVLSLCGDLFLTGVSQRAFMLGLASFLLAHLAYVVAFSVLGLNHKWMLFAAVPVIAVAVLVAAWLAPHTPAELLVPVRIYTIVISVMVIAAVGAKGAGGPTLAVIGAVLFFVSDLSVAAQRLVEMDFPTYVAGLPLYFGGQICLALSTSQHSSQ
jgi:uncharacterized membrane protein YhhN